MERLVPGGFASSTLLDPASTVSATYGVAFQQPFRLSTLPWWIRSARSATFLVDRDGVLRYADDYEVRSPLWTPLELLDAYKEQRRLITSLKSIDQQFREAAELSLAPVGPNTKSAVPVLVEALASEDVSVRAGAAAALYWIASEADEAADQLGASLNDENRQVRRLAVLALGRIGKAAEPYLVAALKQEDAVIRKRAAFDLSRVPALQPESLDALIGALGDRDIHVRRAVVRSLVRLPMNLRTKPVLEAVASTLGDPSQPVRKAAAYGLQGMRPHAQAATPALAKVLRHKHHHSRTLAAVVLRTIGPDAQAAIPALIHNAVYDTGIPRDLALDALKAIGPDATSALLTLLKNGSEKERIGAAKSLGYNQPDDSRVIQGLIELLADESNQVRTQAIKALGEFGPASQAATAALTELLKENDKTIRAAAGTSLKKIDP